MGPNKINIKPLSVDYEDLNTDYGAALNAILEDEIKNEMMYQIMNKHLRESGYHYCYYTQIIPNDWVKENIGGTFHNYGSHWFFKDQSDATIFQLRWFGGDNS
jgi:hypothetical protein